MLTRVFQLLKMLNVDIKTCLHGANWIIHIIANNNIAMIT